MERSQLIFQNFLIYEFEEKENICEEYEDDYPVEMINDAKKCFC